VVAILTTRDLLLNTNYRYPIVGYENQEEAQEPLSSLFIREGKKFFDMLKSSIERVQRG